MWLVDAADDLEVQIVLFLYGIFSSTFIVKSCTLCFSSESIEKLEYPVVVSFQDQL